MSHILSLSHVSPAPLADSSQNKSSVEAFGFNCRLYHNTTLYVSCHIRIQLYLDNHLYIILRVHLYLSSKASFILMISGRPSYNKTWAAMIVMLTVLWGDFLYTGIDFLYVFYSVKSPRIAHREALTIRVMKRSHSSVTAFRCAFVPPKSMSPVPYNSSLRSQRVCLTPQVDHRYQWGDMWNSPPAKQ